MEMLDMIVIPPKVPDWTCNEVMQLIKEYGERPALWDPDCENYKNKVQKQRDWMELAAIFKCDKLEVERKMKILNSQYRREKLKAMKMKKAGMPHRVTWYGYKSFSFLNKTFKIKTEKNSNNTIKEEQSDDQNQENVDMSSDLSYADEHSEINVSDLSRSYLNENEVYGISDVNKESENMPQVNNRLNEAYDSYERDEWTIFGELIAHCLRKLPEEKTRCIAKYKINTVLYEAELSRYK